jgi:hypothetical protein
MVRVNGWPMRSQLGQLTDGFKGKGSILLSNERGTIAKMRMPGLLGEKSSFCSSKCRRILLE